MNSALRETPRSSNGAINNKTKSGRELIIKLKGLTDDMKLKVDVLVDHVTDLSKEIAHLRML